MPRGRTKSRITVAIDPVLARAVDEHVKGMGATRSAAVEEALSDWLRRRIGETYGALERLGEDGNGSPPVRSEAAEARIAAAMVLEALRYQFPAMAGVADEELRRRAVATQRRLREGR